LQYSLSLCDVCFHAAFSRSWNEFHIQPTRVFCWLIAASKPLPTCFCSSTTTYQTLPLSWSVHIASSTSIRSSTLSKLPAVPRSFLLQYAALLPGDLTARAISYLAAPLRSILII
jgi:hypothetical protein